MCDPGPRPGNAITSTMLPDRRNAAAKAFWPRAIAAVPGVWDLERAEGDGVHWRGPIWTFHAEPG